MLSGSITRWEPMTRASWAPIPGPIGYLGTSTNWRVPLPGGATAIPGINFEHKDWLGSAPVVSTRTQTIVADRLFSPYGETIYTYSGGSTDVVFTGDAQDFVQGLFDTPMRELNSAGRWTSPDPAGASWNAYAYTTNPLGETDPSGAWPVGPYYGNSITQDPNTAWDTGLPVCTRPGCDSGNDPIITIKVVVNAESLETAKRNAALQDQIEDWNKGRWSRAQNNNQPTVTVIVTSDKDLGKQYGSHSAVYLNNTSDGPVLYDPAGSYKNNTRGSGGILTKEDDGATVADYTKYQNSTGSKVSTVTIPVSAADQDKIYKNAQSIGDPRGMSCAISVSTALKGVGPFKNLETTHLPGTLLKEVRAIQKTQENPQ